MAYAAEIFYQADDDTLAVRLPKDCAKCMPSTVELIDCNGDYATYRHERTCKNAFADRPYINVFFKCANCGFPKSESVDGQWLASEVKYCPECGDKVVG